MTKLQDNSVRWIRGGKLGDGEFIVKGPALKRGYSTPALGWADDVEVRENEIAVRVLRGGLYTFSGYLVGSHESVKRCLQAALKGESAPPVPFNGTWDELLDAAAYVRPHDAKKLGIEIADSSVERK